MPKNVALDEKVIRIAISNKFYKTFYESAGYSENSMENDVNYVSQPINVFHESVKYINRQIILNDSDVMDVYICLNILELCANANIDSFLYFTENNSSVRIKLLLKDMDFRYWKDKQSSYISILFSLLLYNVEIYYNGDIYLDNFIYFTNGGLMTYKFDLSGYAYYLDILHEDYLLEKAQYTCFKQFDEKNLVFKTSNDENIENALILNSYLSKSPIYMLLSSFSWIFIDVDFLDFIEKEKKVTLYNKDALKHRIEVLHKLLDSNQEVHLAMDFNRMFSYAQNHKVDFLGYSVQFNKSDLTRYARYMAKCLEKYPNVHIYPISSIRALDGIKTYSTDILLTKEDFLIRKHISTLKPLDDRYGQVLDSDLCSRIFKTVERDFHVLELKSLDPDLFLDYCLMHIH